ncbi:MAG: serine/threonine protein kinase [Planctomycetes bacterium]|nr:serine/threonine protein kinase [Planctomycetota bacterium]MCB9886451.1 serine/threonine protein kinase [Planctomycetota bacterium]
MSGDLDTRLFDLAAALEDDLDADATIDLQALANRHGVAAADVERVLGAMRAVHEALGEDLGGQATLAAPDLPADYELGAELGRGGMGVVYRAHQKSLDRDVAVKVLRPGDLVFGTAIARFEREAKSLARLRHRHIVTVHEVGRANGHVYFTMDLVEGKSLQRRIADREMTISRAVKLVRQVCSAMVYAHQKGVVHRDLKPANVLVDDNDDAFVCDFGLARDLGEAGDATLSGQLVGTPAYMSPEQALGEPAKIGEASDIYALGAILYECLAGRPPFHGMQLARLMHAVVTEDPVPLRRIDPRVPHDLAVICGKAMQKRIEDRYATVQALAEDLERFAIGKEILARPRPWPVRAARWAARHRRSLFVAALPMLAVIFAMWWFVVPGLLHTYRVELGDRLYAEGNRDGARIAYAGAGLQLPEPHTQPDARCTRLADALVDEAGRLLALGRADEAEQRVAEARSLLPAANHLRIVVGVLTAEQQELLCDTWYTLQKGNAVLGERLDPSFSTDIFAPRLRRDLSGPNGAAAALLAAELCIYPESVFPELDAARAAWVTTLLRVRAALAEPRQQRLDRLCRGNSVMRLTYCDPRFEQALVALVRDVDLDIEARKDAAALLHRFGSYPFLRGRVREDSANGRTYLCFVGDEDLDAIVARADSLRGLDRDAAFDRRIGFVVETLARPAPELADLNPAQRDMAFWEWLEEHAGSRPRVDEDVAAWWQRHRDEGPRQRLLTALRWDVAPAELTPQRLLQRLRSPGDNRSAYTLAWLHNLLVLTVDASVVAPFWSPFSGDVVARWDRALQAIPGDRFTLRLVTLGFFDAEPAPRILWQRQLPIGLDEPVSWNERTSPDLGLRGISVDFARMPPLPGALANYGQAKLRWAKEGVRGDIPQAAASLVTRTAGRSGEYGHDNDLQPGRVTFTDGRYWADTDGQWWVDMLSLAYLEPATGAPSSWTVADWSRALDETINAFAADDEITKLNNLPIFAAANFLAPVAARDALVRFDAAVRASARQPQDFWDEERRRARLMAGDLTAPDQSEQISYWAKHDAHRDAARQDFAVRLALTTDVAPLRAHAFEQLRGQQLLPAFARTLERAGVNGVELPEWLAARVRGTPGRVAAIVHNVLGRLIVFALFVLATVGFAVAAVRRRRTSWGRIAASFLFFSGLVLMKCSLRIDDVDVFSAWPGYLVSVAALWLGCWRYARGMLWWLLPTWWTATAAWLVASTDPDRGQTALMLAVTLLLYLGLRLRRRSDLRRRASP